ncbi:MAG: hypothetical protein HY904_17765 [Deltaproteobacteria bacterium]|nr:hypothetical protein [Deltaproteobacteria bacterium]
MSFQRLKVGGLRMGLVLAGVVAAGTGGCGGCSGIGNRVVTVNFTVDGVSAAEGCTRQGATKVKARARWSTGENSVKTSDASANCEDGSIEVTLGGNGTIQLTAYDTDGADAVAMGVSAPVSVDLESGLSEQVLDVDIIPLRGRITVHGTCGGGSCTGKVQMDGADAPTMVLLVDTNGFDLEQVDTQVMHLMPDDGHLMAESIRGRVDAVNVVRVNARATDGTALRGEARLALTGLQAESMVDLVPVVTPFDAGFHPTSSSGGVAVSSSGAAQSSSAAATSGAPASSAAGQSSSAVEPSSSAAAASSAAPASSAATASSAAPASSATPASSAAAASSAAPASSAAAASSAGGASSAAAASSAAGASSAGTASSLAGNSSSQ